MPTARQPSKEAAGALLVVTIAAYLTSAAFLAAPASPAFHAASIFSRPWVLLPGALFLFAAIFFRQRLRNDRKEKNPASLYDYSLFAVAALNFICHLSATFSRHLFDGPFFLAELSKTASYVVMLGGALLDQARLFDQVRSMAVSDSLTGLANYRRLISVLEAELDRSRRTQRAFSVVLLEAGRDIAARVVGRVRERLAAEAEPPALSVSAGVAAFPEDGDTPEKLLAAADRALYRMKNRGTSVQNLARIAACL